METNPQSNPENISSPLHEQETFWAMLIHFSVFTGFLTFLGFFLGPLIIWLIYREKWPSLDAHFKEAINFQISVLLYGIALILIAVLTLGLGLVVAVPLLIVLAILDIVFPILAAIKAREGEVYRYPISIRLVN